MLSRRDVILVAVVSLIGFPALAQEPRPVPAGQFEKIHSLIKRQAGEWKWAELPWSIDFADAQRRSLAEGKPIFAVLCAQGCVAGYT